MAGDFMEGFSGAFLVGLRGGFFGGGGGGGGVEAEAERVGDHGAHGFFREGFGPVEVGGGEGGGEGGEWD